MNPLAVPFTVNQKVFIPAGTPKMQDGIQGSSLKDVTATVLTILHGYMEVVAGAVISHPPLILALTGRNSASYEVSPALLTANGFPTKSLAVFQFPETITAA